MFKIEFEDGSFYCTGKNKDRVRHWKVKEHPEKLIVSKHGKGKWKTAKVIERVAKTIILNP